MEPQAANLPKSAVETIAARFAEKVGYGSRDDLNELVRILGGSVEYRDFEDLAQSGFLEVRAPADFTIYLPSYTGRLRDRFTIAHELGHYVLHSRLGKVPIHVRRAESSPVEWEANWFAAAFLMPEQEFRKAWEAGERRLDLAVRFDVSLAAVDVRSRLLGLDDTVQDDADRG